MNPIRLFMIGFTSPLRGFHHLLNDRKSLVFALIPWLLLLLIGGLLWAFLGSWLVSLSAGWLGQTETWQYLQGLLQVKEFSFLDLILQVVIWLFLLFVVVYFSYFLLGVLGAPFYTLLAERILRKNGLSTPAFSMRDTVISFARMLGVSLRKLLIFAIIFMMVWVVALVPVLWVVGPFVIVHLLAYDCFDYSLECRLKGLSERWQFFKSHFFLVSGLAIFLFIASFVPGLILLGLPVFVAGAAEAYASLPGKENL